MSKPTTGIFSHSYWNIAQLDTQCLAKIQQTLDNKTKPLGALGKLESIAKQLCQIQGQHSEHYQHIDINQPAIMIFAADHGIAKHGVSIAPSEVTGQMVQNFLAGGAAINCFCNSLAIDMKVIDAGILHALDISHPILTKQRIAAGTADFSTEPAMTSSQAEQALEMGEIAAKQQLNTGSNVLGFGEMGIGNTSAASALLSALTGLSAAQTTGMGTGITSQQLDKKVQLIDQALARLKEKYHTNILSPDIALMEVGGFEIAQIAGAMLATAAAGKSIVVDGFIVSVAALIATRIAPRSQQFMFFAHCSAEKGHQIVLKELNAKPLLDLGLRLGEGTGAALAIPLFKAASGFYNNMATFESAQVEV